MQGCHRCTQVSETTALPAVTATPDWTQATVAVEKLDVWDDPANENSYWHRQTQLITGERVTVLDEKGAWAQIIAVMQPSSKDPRGYPGWVRKSGLTRRWNPANNYLIVITRTANAYASPDLNSDRLMRLYFDARLPYLTRQDDTMQVILPDGRVAWLPVADVTLIDSNGQNVLSQITGLPDLARTLAGAPYLWGGATPDSPDCSGFTYRLFHVYGIILARDANDQALQGQAVSFDNRKPGDLVFYTDVSGGPVTHVGVYMGNNQIMDANPWLGLSVHPLSDMQKWYVFYSVRRFISLP